MITHRTGTVAQPRKPIILAREVFDDTTEPAYKLLVPCPVCDQPLKGLIVYVLVGSRQHREVSVAIHAACSGTG